MRRTRTIVRRIQPKDETAGGPRVSVGNQAHRDALAAAQAELEEARSRYADLYDSAPFGFVTLSRTGIIQGVNLTGARLLGFSRRQLLQQPLLVFIARGDRREFLRYLSQLRRLPGTRVTELQLARKAGATTISVELVATSSPGSGAEPPCFQIALIDVSARREAEKALRESEERFRTLADHAPVGIFLCDAEGEVRYVNETWCLLTGFQFEDALGRGWLNAVHPGDRDRIATGWQNAVRHGTTAAAEFRFLRAEGDPVWVQGRAVQLRNADGECTGLIGTIADVTDRKRAEVETKRAHAEIMAASEAKDRFLAMLSHELRTPLNPVLLLAGEAVRNRDLPPGVRADFDAIRKGIETEARLIDDLLDITRITHGKLSLEKGALDVHAVLREAIATVEGDMARKNIRLKLALKARRHQIVGDSVRLQQIFWNLLKNAIKFTPEHGLITVETSSNGSTISVKVRDSGVGIGEADLSGIFAPFAQGDKTSYGGLGLGLAISKKLVELHDGSIRAFSDGHNAGATFSTTFPLLREKRASARTARSADCAPALPAPVGKGERRSRVLLVEDHEPTRAALTRLLLRRRFEVTGAGSLAEARSCAEKTGPGFDLLISDIGLPDGTGYDLMIQLRQQHKLKGIALTGYGMDEDVQRSYAAGFATHLTKPVKIESLDAALASVLQNPVMREH